MRSTYTTLSRHTIRIALVTLLVMLGSQTHGQFDFSTATVSWDEEHGFEGADGGTSLANLNSVVNSALSDPTDATLCYFLSGTPANALGFNASATACSIGERMGARSVADNWITLKSNRHVDYELGATQLLTITGYDADGEQQTSFVVTLVITDADERPEVTQKASETNLRYWVPGDSVRLLIFDLFQDPDGDNVYFDSSATATDVWVCDTANAGDFTIGENPVAGARDQGLGTPVSFGGGDAAANCSVSNEADPDATPAPDPSPGVRGSGGNRVVTTRRLGPYLDIKADSLADDTDDDGTVTERGAGTYAAHVYIRGWSGAPESALSSDAFAVIKLLVKVGANNPPQFAGDATGFAVTLIEGDDLSDPMPAWAAGDLDAGGSTIDSLVYGLNSTSTKNASVAGGTVSLVETMGDNPATSAAETDFVVALALRGKGLNFESGPSPFEIELVVTDRWSDPVHIPIQITLVDVNELKRKTGIDDQRLSNGLSRSFDLSRYFEDPEGDEITYEAYTNLYDDIAEVDNDTDTLTIHGKHAKQGEGGESTVTVTVIATDSKGLLAEDHFELVTRYTNQTPSFVALENETIVLGTSIFEAESAGKLLMPLIEYTDDDPTPTLVFDHAPLFKAIVNPSTRENAICTTSKDADCVQQSGTVAIIVGDQDLNFEAQTIHKLSIALRDAWEPELVSAPISFHVAVHDSNDAPVVVPSSSPEDRRIVAHGSDSYSAGHHFTDEDGDRLRINAESSDSTIVEVEVTQLDQVFFRGLKEGQARITLIAVDPEGESAETHFQVSVGPNNAPIVDEATLASQLPDGNVLGVGEFEEIHLASVFVEPDQGDTITSLAAVTSDENVLLAIPTDDGNTSTLVGRASGTATLTITAMDRAGNTTSVERDIIVNGPPAVISTLDPVTLDRTTPRLVDIANVFDDPDHSREELVITAAANEDGEDRVALSVTGTQLTIVGVMGATPGDAEIQVTATDPHGFTASTTFVATVINIGPTVATNIDSQQLDRINPLDLDISGVFDDADGDIQSISVTVADERVAESSEITESNVLTVRGIALGTTTVSLTATDDNDAYTIATFDVTVINIEPIVSKVIADQSTTRTRDLVINVGSTFHDPDADDDLLTTTVDVVDGGIARASLEGKFLTLAGLAVGQSNVSLHTSDADGGTAETSFMVTIENIEPVVVNSFAPIDLEVGGEAVSRSMERLFLDDDPLTYAITVTDRSVAGATVVESDAMVTPVSRGTTNLEITATDPHGARAVVTGTVTVSDGRLRIVASQSLGSFGRAMIASVSSSVGQRVMLDQRSSDLPLDTWSPIGAFDVKSRLTVAQRDDLDWVNVNTSEHSTAMALESTSATHTIRSTIGREFALNLGSRENPSRWAVWGSADIQSYDGDGYDGMSSSVYLGADATVTESWLVGVAVGSNAGESDYTWGTATQSMELSLNSIYPYIRYQPTVRTSLWGVAGFGSGELETTVVGHDNHTSSLSSRLALVGSSQTLTSVGRFDLALRGDAALASLETDEGNGAADALSAEVSRIRLGVESSFSTDTGQGGSLEPFGQVHLRSDSGDAENGTGLEIVGGVRISGKTFRLEAQGRTLAMHGADEYRESGFSVLAKLIPSADGTGFSASIAPQWGADAAGNDIMWQDSLDYRSLPSYSAMSGFRNTSPNKAIDAQFAFGWFVANDHYLLTPFVDVSVGDMARHELQFGVNLHRNIRNARSFDLNLVLGRLEGRNGPSEGSIGVNTTLNL